MQTLSAFTAVLILLTFQCSAQLLPWPPESGEFLEAHNRARSEVGVGALRWSPTLAESASLTVKRQRDKRSCSFINLRHSRYGGNQLWASGSREAPRAVVEAWVVEKKFYSYENNTCEGQPAQLCGTYTQVVWRKSAELGCAQVTCQNKQPVGPSSLTLCFYNPRGNVVGEKPY